MKNRSKDRFEGIVEQFIKNDLIAREEYSYYLYGLKHLEILSLTTGGVYRGSGGDFIFHRIEKVSNQQGVKRMEKMYLDLRSCRFVGGVRHLCQK